AGGGRRGGGAGEAAAAAGARAAAAATGRAAPGGGAAPRGRPADGATPRGRAGDRPAADGANAASPPERPAGGGRFAGRSAWRLKRDLAELEARIHDLEGELERIGAGLARPDTARDLVPELARRPGPPPTDAEVIAALGERHADLEGRLLAMMEEWHELTEAVGA